MKILPFEIATVNASLELEVNSDFILENVSIGQSEIVSAAVENIITLQFRRCSVENSLYTMRNYSNSSDSGAAPLSE